MITIIQSPENVVFCKNPVVYVIETTTVSTNHYLHVRIKDLSNQLIGEDAVEVSGGSAVFDISNFLLKEFPMFDISAIMTAGIIPMPGAEFVQVEFFETYSLSNSEHNNISASDILVLQGGLSKMFLATFNGNISSLLSEFLTWCQPKKISTNEPDMLFFLNINGVQLRSKIEITFSDNSTQIQYSDFVLPYDAGYYAVNSSYLYNNLAASDSLENPIVKYTVAIESEEDEIVVNPRTFDVQRDYFPEITQFVCMNSFGAYDFLNLKGAEISESEFTRTEGSYQSESKIINSEFFQKKTANTGWLNYSFKNSLRAKKYLIELFNSKKLYEISDSKIIPYVQLSDEMLSTRSDKYLHSTELEARRARLSKFITI